MAADYATLKKGGFMRQKQKNNFSLRLAVVGGQLTTKQLAVITEVADKYGHGYVHLTSRQSVEIPFIKLEDVENVKNTERMIIQAKTATEYFTMSFLVGHFTSFISFLTFFKNLSFFSFLIWQRASTQV